MSTSDPADTSKPTTPDSKGFHIRIDRTDYVVTQDKLSGA